ncbi:serine/threonine-protein kinase ATM isoform X2 [Nymphaea colorata]|uniref:serine/threonine-protein kinase ATM isoform X2 n=1 Tax=Nymphaea colorata TaxID=210225 RepID=UPI00129DD2E3|nr:serine/threonine-protein kinase ATM isoform X2 [Nymphaea colorata]
MATSRDIQEVVSKLSSDKSKTREEGVKLLGTWMEGERAISFCKLLSRNTAKLRHDDIPHCRRLVLLAAAKAIFGHLLDVIRDVPSFRSEYSSILRQLLGIKEYRLHMRKRIYENLVLLYMHKIGTILGGGDHKSAASKEEVFRFIQTLLALLEYPVGDFHDNLRNEIVKGFIHMFSNLREEGKISRKLIECMNMYLIKDGPNLGRRSLKIHLALQDFMSRFWLSTHDHGLKDALVLYAKIQLKLARSISDMSGLIEFLLDVLSKEFDQAIITGSTIIRPSDVDRDVRAAHPTGLERSLMELAACVFQKACLHTIKLPSTSKRLKKENAASRLKEGIISGKWLWNGSFCYLMRNYHHLIPEALAIDWFKGICESFERILSEGISLCAYDGPLWVLRSLQELSSLLTFPKSTTSSCATSAFTKDSNEVKDGWLRIWSSLMHWLPIFSNVAPLVDEALKLLGGIFSNNLVQGFLVPQDVWDLRIFKHLPSPSSLYFIICYFSRSGYQGNSRDTLLLRESLLRGVFKLLDLKEGLLLNQRNLKLFSAAVFSICAAHELFPSPSSAQLNTCKNNVEPVLDDWMQQAAEEHASISDLNSLECSVEALGELKLHTSNEVQIHCWNSSLHLPVSVRQPLLLEMEDSLLRTLNRSLEIQQLSLSDLFSLCALLSNVVYGSLIVGQGGKSCFIKEMLLHLEKLLRQAFSILETNFCQICSSLPDTPSSAVTALRSLTASPLLLISKERNSFSEEHFSRVKSLAEMILVGMKKIFEELSIFTSKEESEEYMSGSILSSTYSENCSTQMRIVDIELDADNDARDGDLFATSSVWLGRFSCFKQLKVEMVSSISNFFLVLPDLTWEIMSSIMKKETDPEVCESVLYQLGKAFSCLPTRDPADMVNLIKDSMNMSEGLEFASSGCLTAIHAFLESLVALSCHKSKENSSHHEKGRSPEQNYANLGELLSRVVDIEFYEWPLRVRLIDCICYFICLDPCTAEGMVDKLFAMLQDSDFRVRMHLARHLGLLFQTWDGHEQLFQDICCNLGMKFPVALKGMLVTEKDVMDAGGQSEAVSETAIITLSHLAFSSEKMEVEALFIIFAIAAMDALQRALVVFVLDSLSKSLCYDTRFKYLEIHIGSILSRWVTCGISLTTLVEIRYFFMLDSEPNVFLRHCCPWLLPLLILNRNSAALHWVSMVASEPLAGLARTYFVPIYSICIALHCSNNIDKDKGAKVLCSSVLQIAEITEQERDDLIKKQMIAIVSCLFSLCSAASDPSVPYFCKDTVVLAVQTTVDGFLDMDSIPKRAGVVDKIHVFRSDRVFRFLLEIHHQITAASVPWHKFHVLARLEAFIDVIGYRTSVSSTSCYLFNLIGQCIEFPVLEEKCCFLISLLLENFRNNSSSDSISVLGEQLQFLVSKLVACCISVDQRDRCTNMPSSSALFLLHKLIVEADESLYGYIMELEPLPEVDCFEKIRTFHQKLQSSCSAADQFVKFVQRMGDLPQAVRFWRLRALHWKLSMREIIQPEKNMNECQKESSYWHCDPSTVSAVWALISKCSSDDPKDVRHMAADFLSRVGIGDPYRTTVRLPGNSTKFHVQIADPYSQRASAFSTDIGVSDERLTVLITLLRKYLLDVSVTTVDMAAQTLQGILSTERGSRALSSFNSYDKSFLEIHSKGVNLNHVEHLLSKFESKSSLEATSLDESSLWQTNGKTFERWVCTLVYSLIHHTKDVTLRLCQNVVLLKAEVAELLFPDVLASLAIRKHSSADLCELISLQVQNHIFVESNRMRKSIQVMLDAMNELRLLYVMERAGKFSPQSTRLSTKGSRSSSGRNSRSPLLENHSPSLSSSAEVISCLSWDKVYWLNIDYLVVAKSAIFCGLFFSAILYVELWCEEHFKSLTLGNPDFSLLATLPAHVELLVAAMTKINEPDSIYGIIQSHKLPSQIITYEHEGNWSKALENYDLLARTAQMKQGDDYITNKMAERSKRCHSLMLYEAEKGTACFETYKGLMRALQQTGCTHVLDLYCQGLTTQGDRFLQDEDFTELQYEAAWRTGNWDFASLSLDESLLHLDEQLFVENNHFNRNLHCCLRALQEGDPCQYRTCLLNSKQELVMSIAEASKESAEDINSSIIKLQILDHLTQAWFLRWVPSDKKRCSIQTIQKISAEPLIPDNSQLEWLNKDWKLIVKQTQLHQDLLEPFISFRRVLLQILNCRSSTMEHLLQSASIFRKGGRFSLATSALQEFKVLTAELEAESQNICSLGRMEEAKLLRAQGQHDFAINLARYILQHYHLRNEACDVFRLTGKWLAETRSTNSRTILEQYLKRAVDLSELNSCNEEKNMARQCQANFQLAHYADTLFRGCEERLCSSEWQAAMRLRRHKAKELEALIKRLKSLTKGEKIDCSVKIQDLQKQLAMDAEEANKLKDDRDNFLNLALEGYKRCLVVGDKYDMRVVFRLISLWFSLWSDQNVIKAMTGAVKEVQSYKFIPLVYQIASRMGSLKEGNGLPTFQLALISLVKKMTIDHPYHTIFQLLALANGDRVKDKQRSKNSFVIDLEKKHAAENLLNELSSYHGAKIQQMKQMVEIYIKLAELETRKEDTNKKIAVPREIRSLRQLELVPVVTATIPIDHSCEYPEGSFPYFKGFADSIMIMNGINAPKVVECLGSDGHLYRQLAKSGNDDLRQDAVMEQFFGLVNTFLHSRHVTWRRKLRIRTYKVVPFTPSAGVLEWVNGTVPLGEYLLGSMKTGGAHGRYGKGDWSFLQCREHMTNEKDKRKAFQRVCENFRPVLHFFFLERFSQPADWFESRLSYTRSVAASSMVGYIVGLGDRHSMNILIDQTTAEVVHIDLGVAFEQGLMLKTPERVPFRLTRDIIDGMGVTGVDGVFRRCCEETLSVMRTNKEALLTIIEVFIHDPLYKWALSPLKALQRQKETDDDIDSSFDDSDDEYEGNKDATRALMRVKHKLDGYEEGEMRSVQGQVQQLIQNAVDTDRLAHMFPGWGAWL